MARHFYFPQTLEALEKEPPEEHTVVYARFPTDVTSLPNSELEEFVKGLVFDLSDKELFCIEEQDVFDRVYSLVRSFLLLSPQCKLSLLDGLRSNLAVLLPNIDSLSRTAQQYDEEEDSSGRPLFILDRLLSHRNAFKIYVYFLVMIFQVEDVSSRSGKQVKPIASTRKKLPLTSWNWDVQRVRILNVIANSLEANLLLLFGSPDENFLSFIAKNTFLMLENPTLLKDSETQNSLCRIVAAFSTKYQYISQSCASVIHLIHKYDFVVATMADAMALAERKYADGTLASSVIREIGRTNPKAYVKDTVGAENVGRFLVEISDRLPKLISTNVGVLVPHFGGESYKIRNALVSVLGKLVSKAFNETDGEINSKSIRLRTKQAMLEILLERCRDVSAYTRSRVLQVWAELCEYHSVSIGHWTEVASIAVGRLEDKSAFVRKSALTLLIMMLQHNPFGPQLRISSFEATLMLYKKKLNDLEPEKNADNFIGGVNDSELCDGEVDNESNENSQDGKVLSFSDSLFPSQGGSPSKDIMLPDVGNIEQTRALVASLEAGLTFSKCITNAMPILAQLMASSSASDVENTIQLLMRCKQFQIDGADAYLRKMLPLAFSEDKSIYEAIENAFITIYITKNPIETARNLISLVIDANIGDIAALEHIVGALVSKGDISSSMISGLWDFFCFNINGTTVEQSRGALSILCMAAATTTGILGNHLHYIMDIGFGRWAKVDILLARTACVALQRLSGEEKNGLLATYGNRVFATLEKLVAGFWLPDDIWYGAADKAIPAIYAIHPTPEILAATLIKKCLCSVFSNDETKDSWDNSNDFSIDELVLVRAGRLNRFLFVASHVAMNQLLYIESCAKKIQKQKVKKDRLNSTRQTSDEQSIALESNGINNELGISASEDAILDTISARAEKEIISGENNEKNLLGHCAPFLSKLCKNISLMQKYPELHTSGMLALCRFMIIDSSFCEANLQLLFTVVESSHSEAVRSNCTIALGDLAVRFPNLLEPWTENMYARLRDPSACVRKNAVLVLSHLILNDMMKVKGYINEMALRLEDTDERIANLAKLFFHELSKKGSNPIYNLLPDMLGKLSNQDLPRETFCNIMQFLLNSIKKDKQMEALVEKLCNRFSGVADVRQWENLSYCLSQLTFTERGIKKLIELFKSYETALSEDSVLIHFQSIFSKAKKTAKPEQRSCIEEIEERANKANSEWKEQHEATRRAQIHIAKTEAPEHSEESSATGGGVINPSPEPDDELSSDECSS